MANLQKFLLPILLTCAMVSITMGRPLGSKSDLAARLQGDDMTNCWSSLFELQSCTGEVILFFLNGETYLGPDCCQAIRTIEHHCWPPMLGTLGFTAEEGDILRGYCDATESNSQPPPPQRIVGPTVTVSHGLVP